MNILKLTKLKLAAYLTGAVAAVAVVYKVSQTSKDKIDILLNKVLDRDNFTVENASVEKTRSQIITLWDDDDDFEDDYIEDDEG